MVPHGLRHKGEPYEHSPPGLATLSLPPILQALATSACLCHMSVPLPMLPFSLEHLPCAPDWQILVVF